MTTRKEQALHTKRKIFDIAIQLFAKHSFDKVAIKTICEACKISIGGFYHHYKSKTDILDEGYRLFDMQVKEAFEHYPNQSSMDALYFLIQEQTKSIELLGYQAYSQYLSHTIQINEKYIFNTNRFFPQKVHECVKHAVLCHQLCGDPNMIAEEILSTTRSIAYDWCLHNGNYSLSERSLKLTKMILCFYSQF